MKSILAFIFASVIVLGFSLANYLGAFKDVDVQATEAGPYRLVYKAHVGAYHKIVPTIEEVERWATANGESCQTSFGEYLEDPDVIEEDRLHSNGGCLVTKDWAGKVPADFLYREIPKRLFVLAVFDGAPSIGPQKVYPRAARFIEAGGYKRDGAVLEFYERVGARGLTTRYHFPVLPAPTVNR